MSVHFVSIEYSLLSNDILTTKTLVFRRLAQMILPEMYTQSTSSYVESAMITEDERWGAEHMEYIVINNIEDFIKQVPDYVKPIMNAYDWKLEIKSFNTERIIKRQSESSPYVYEFINDMTHTYVQLTNTQSVLQQASRMLHTLMNPYVYEL